MSETITANKIGIFNYELKDENGEILYSSQGHPMPYLHGHDNVISGLEEQLEGKKIGDQLQAVVPPTKGYGEYDENANFSVHRSELDKNILEDGYLTALEIGGMDLSGTELVTISSCDSGEGDYVLMNL